MESFEIIIDCIMAIGSLATAGTLIYMIRSQKGADKQIRSLTQLAEIARIQAGTDLYPKIQVKIEQDERVGLKIKVKNNSYPLKIYRVIIFESHQKQDVEINHRENYIVIDKGDVKTIYPADYALKPVFCFPGSYIKLFVMTPFNDAFEIKYAIDLEDETSLSEPKPTAFPNEVANAKKKTITTSNSYSISGATRSVWEKLCPEIKEAEDF